MTKVHHGRWVGTSFLFIGGRISAYVDYLLESTRKGHLIPGAVIFSIGKPSSPRTIGTEVVSANSISQSPEKVISASSIYLFILLKLFTFLWLNYASKFYLIITAGGEFQDWITIRYIFQRIICILHINGGYLCYNIYLRFLINIMLEMKPKEGCREIFFLLCMQVVSLAFHQ